MDWMQRALCRGLHSDLWFPPAFKQERTAPESQYFDVAKMVCEQCPVKGKCFALGREEEFGVWGGSTPKERMTGDVRPPKRVLPLRHVKQLPPHEPDVRVDIPSLKVSLKRYTERRES